MAIAPPQDDILIRVQQRLAQRGITGAEAASIVAKIEAKLGRVSGSGAGMQRAVGQPSIPTPRGEPVDPRYAKFQVDPNDRLVARGLKPRQIAATPEEIAAEGMRFAAPTTQPVEKRGMFSSGARAFYGGLEDAGDFGITADMLAADNRVTFEVGNRFAQIQAQKRSRPMSEGAAAYAQASQGGAMSLLSFAADRPGAFLQGAIDQNLQSLGSTAASIVGASIAGSLAPTLMGWGSGLAEASNELAAALEAEGVDVTDGGAVTRAMNTPDVRARVRDRVLTKSTTVGAADFATMGIASRIPGGKTFMGKLASQVAQTGVEAAGGMAGEAASQVLSGQELQTGDILSEGIGELLPGSAQVAALGARRLLNPTTPPPASPTPGGPAPGGVGGNARPPSPPSTTPVDPMDAVADSLDDRFKMKPSVLNPLATPPAVNPGPAPGMVPGEGDDFAVKGRRTQREAPAIPDEGDSFAIKGRKPANEYEGVAFKGRPRVSPKPAPAQQADEYDAAIENIKRQRESKRRAKAPAAEIQALDGAAQNLITQKDLVSRGWILDRRFGLMDPGQQESMILAGERLDPVWGTPQNLREADPADLERLGIARPKPKPFTPPAPPQGRADTLAELLGMDSEEDARRYAQSLSPLERERLGLPQRAPEGQQQGAASQSPAGGTSTASRPESNPAGQAATAPTERTPGARQATQRAELTPVTGTQETTRGSTNRTPQTTAPDSRPVASPQSTREPFTVKAYRGQKKGQAADERVGGARFFSGARDLAQTYAGDGGEVLEETLTFTNPLVTANAGTLKQTLGLPPSAPLSRAIDDARKAGHDGIVMERMVDGPEYVDLSPDAGKKAPREPWQMTTREYVDSLPDTPAAARRFINREYGGISKIRQNPRGTGVVLDVGGKVAESSTVRGAVKQWIDAHGGTSSHREQVNIARLEGKPVPPEVLAEYGMTPNPPAKPDGSVELVQNRQSSFMRERALTIDKIAAMSTQEIDDIDEEWEKAGYADTAKSEAPAKAWTAEVEANIRKFAETGTPRSFLPLVLWPWQTTNQIDSIFDDAKAKRDAADLAKRTEEHNSIIASANDASLDDAVDLTDVQAVEKRLETLMYAMKGMMADQPEWEALYQRGRRLATRAKWAGRKSKRGDSQPQPGGSVPAATNQEPANGEEAPQAERLLNAGTAAPVSTGAMGDSNAADGAMFDDPPDKELKRLPNEADDEYDWRQYADNAQKTADSPATATLRNLYRAAGYFQRVADSYSRRGNAVMAESMTREYNAVDFFRRSMMREMDSVGLTFEEVADWKPEEVQRVVKARRDRGKAAKPAPAESSDPRGTGVVGANTDPLPHHVAVYGDKAVSMEYVEGDQFKLAGMRVADNAGEGYVVTPMLKVFAIRKGKKYAQRVTDQAEADRAIEMARGAFGKVAEQAVTQPAQGEGGRGKPKPGDAAKAERQAEVDAIAPDAELDTTGAPTSIADIANNVREGKRRYATARDSQNKRLGASMLAAVRSSVESGMSRLREERAKWKARTANAARASATIDDIPEAVAVRAFEGTSHSPDVRGASWRRSYVQSFDTVADRLRTMADTDELRAAIESELQRFHEGLKSRYLAFFASRANVMSSMITGPARFPVEANRKRMESADKRLEEIVEFTKRAEKAIIRKLFPQASGVIRSDDENAPDALRAKIEGLQRRQEAMKDANKIIRKGGDPAAMVPKLEALGFSNDEARRVLFPQFQRGMGFPGYSLTNNSANIRRLQERLTQIEAQRAREPRTATFPGGKVVENAEMQRVQIIYPDKPDDATLEKLKSRGFKWAPSQGAHQRLMNEQAWRAALQVTGATEDAKAPAQTENTEEIDAAEVAAEVERRKQADADTIPQENADGTDRGTTGGVGAARGDGQGPGQGQQGTNAQATRGNAAPAGGVREEPPAAQAQVGGASDSQIRAAKAAAKQTAKAERRKQGARKAADTKAFNARNPQRFSRADVAARIIEKAQQIPDSEQQYGVLGDAEDPNAPGDYVSFAFPRKIPTEVLHAIDAEPQLRTLLSVNPRGLGPDWLGYLGVDKYVAQLRSMFYEGDGASTYGLTTAVRRLEGWADNRQDPEAVFLLWLHDAVNNTEYQRPDWENVATSEFKDGDRFTIAGVPFEVMQDENGYTTVTQRGEDFGPIDNAATFIHEAMEDMPIDKDSRSTADVGEVPDFAPPESPSPTTPPKFSDSEGVFGQKTENITGSQTGLFGSAKPVPVEAPKPKPAQWQVGDKFTIRKGNALGLPGDTWTVVGTTIEDYRTLDDDGNGNDVFVTKPSRKLQLTGSRKGNDYIYVWEEDLARHVQPPEADYRRESALKAMTPDEAQERYPGIRRGETVAEYEKRIGITDTPDMFAGAEDRGDINKAKRGRPKHAIQFKTPIVGPSGAKILAYEWTWTWETVDTKDDTVERRVSDWERAELNDDTNRLIVHQFSVQQPNGDVRTVSLESALQMLGYMDKATGAPIRSLASTLKTLAFNRMKLEQLRKKYEVFAEATKQAHALPFNPKEITREVTDAEFSHLKREGVKRVAWLYRGDVLRWDYWYPSSGTPIPTVFGPNVDMDATAYSWRDSQLKRFIPSDAEGLTESDRKYPENTRARLSQEIKDIERRNEKLQRKIDAFDGSGGGPSSSGGDPRAPQRAPSNMADRAIGALERIAADAEARMQARAKKRGTRLYSTPIPDPRDMIDAAAWAAGKALVAGIKSSRAIGKFVTDQVAARWPDAKFDPAVLRRTARRFMDGAKTPQDVYARWQAARNKDDAARTKAAAGAAADPKAVKEAAAVGTAQRPDVAARIVAEVRKSFRAGKEAGRVQALAALKPVITKAKQAAIRAEQMRKIEQRGGKDAAAAATQAAKVQTETEAGIRDEAVRLVQSIPGVGRRYLKAVSTAKGMRDLQRILHRLRKDLAKSVARDSRRRAQVMAKMFKKLNDDRLALARKALYDIEEAWKAIKSKDTGTIRAEELAQAMRESAEQIKALITEQRDEDKVRVLGKMILMSEHRDDMVERITRQKELPQTEKVGADRTPGGVRLFMRKYANFRTLMQILDGQFDENGIFARAHRAMAARRTLELGKNQEFIDRAEAIVKANGYKSWADFTKRTTGSLGDASVDFVNIELGDRKRIPVGLAMALYAQDPETKSLMHEGQVFKFHRNDLQGFTVDDYKLAELEAALTPAQKTIAVAINRLRSDMQYDRADAVYKDITGNRLVKVPDHYPRQRILDQTGNPDTMDVARMAVGEWAVQSLENSGFTIQRVNSRAPLLLSDFAETQVRAFQGTEMMIQRAQLVKYLKGTIMHPDVINQINARYGTAMVKRLAGVIAEYSGNSQPESDKIIRRIASKLAQTMTQTNPLTWLRNLSTVFRLPLALVDGSPIATGDVLAAMPKAAASMSKTMGLLLKHSPDLRHRWSHAGAAISLMPTGAAPDADSHFADAGKATIRQLLHAAKGLKTGNFTERAGQAGRAYDATLDAIRLGNTFDGYAAAVAYHVFRTKAPTNLSPAAQDRWAARRAADAFMQTANTNDLLNATEFQTDARRNTMTALLLTFTSDIAKMQNLAYLSGKRGGKSMGVTAGSIVASVAWSTAIRYVAAAVLGDDEEKRDEEAVQSVMDELISLLPGGVNLWAPAFKLYTTGSTYGGSGLLDTPLTSLVRHFEAIVRELKKDDTNTAEAAYRLFRLVADPMGNPVGPLSGMARRAIKNYGE